ncbi:MAG: glucose 1-dehydrogenase [Sulfuricaulis sp.]|nr:glucose 1-dehydrogenase [Sulfuricaulis sp.]
MTKRDTNSTHAGRKGRLEGQVAIITGGASGMGRAATLIFLDEGARVVVADLNTITGAETIALATERGHGDAVCFQRTDVSQEADIEAMVACALDRFGRLDCLFNNAGLGGALGPIVDTTMEDWDRTQHMMLRSVFLGIKHGGRAMLKQGSGGSIINTASVAGLGGGGGMPAYSAAKAGVINLTQNAALELAPGHIRVNAIAPGFVQTPLIHAKSKEDMARFVGGRQPWPDTGMPDDIAYAALYLASKESSFVTGETIRVDGGLLAAGPGLFPNRAIHATPGGSFAMSGAKERPGKDSVR